MSTTPLGPGPDVHTLTGAYAADALDGADREQFEAHLAVCEDCREEVRGLRETVALLGVAASVPPPQRLKASVLDQVSRTPQLPPLPVAAPAVPAPRRSAGSRLLAAAAALVLVAGLGVGVLGLQARQDAQQQAQQAREAARQAQVELGRIQAVIADPSARTIRQPVSGGGTATVVVAGREAVLLGADLEPLPADRLYQLWYVGGDGRITSAGLGPAAADGAGRWSRLLEGVPTGTAVAISVEPLGGSPQPTTIPLVAVQT